MGSNKIIAHLREEKGWSQTDLADKSSVMLILIRKPYKGYKTLKTLLHKLRTNCFFLDTVIRDNKTQQVYLNR